MDTPADARQSVQNVPTPAAWYATRPTLTSANAVAARPNTSASHGRSRQRVVPPARSSTTSQAYAAAPSAASGTGRRRESVLWRTRRLPSPKIGSHTEPMAPSW